MPLLRVIKPQAAGTSAVHSWQERRPDGIDICLACWKDYMAADDRDLGAARLKLHARGQGEESDGYESDPWGEQRKADMKVGEATDAMIDSLARLHIWAIYKACGIGQVWRFTPDDFAVVLMAARGELETKLRSNRVTALRFD